MEELVRLGASVVVFDERRGFWWIFLSNPFR